MDDRIAHIIGSATLEELQRFENNARARHALTDDMKEAIRARSTELGRALVAERTGIDLSSLTPAEDKIVRAVSEYVSIRKREGRPANRTFLQLRNRGLIGAVEESVTKSKPAQGFTTLADAHLEELSYEQIVIDHPEEFSPRALWFARRTLGLPNDTEKPPTKVRAGIEADTRSSTVGNATSGAAQTEGDYWVFVCNTKKWAIDRFFDRRIERDTWGVRPSDRERFAPGQFGILRVGVDRRSVAERNGSPSLEAGIYALCEVESAAFEGTGASDEFWAPGEGRGAGWPTVNLRYLRTFLDAPLTIARLREEAPDISPLLLKGFQAASFPISAKNFHRVLRLLDLDAEDLGSPAQHSDIAVDKLAAMEQRYLQASPEAKERLSRTIERGQIGAWVKRANGFRCQICAALGRDPLGFLMRNGERYVEAHHVMPVSKREIGSLAAANVMTVCANHHRQVHYGDFDVRITTDSFEFVIDGAPVKIGRLSLAAADGGKKLEETRSKPLEPAK